MLYSRTYRQFSPEMQHSCSQPVGISIEGDGALFTACGIFIVGLWVPHTVAEKKPSGMSTKSSERWRGKCSPGRLKPPIPKNGQTSAA